MLNYISSPSTYAYYTNNSILRPVSMLDITSDPNIYNHKLSTSLMQYNTLYSAISPYGEATPNRAGVDFIHAEYGYGEVECEVSLKSITNLNSLLV
mgnify:CR=1 FL=1